MKKKQKSNNPIIGYLYGYKDVLRVEENNSFVVRTVSETSQKPPEKSLRGKKDFWVEEIRVGDCHNLFIGKSELEQLFESEFKIFLQAFDDTSSRNRSRIYNEVMTRDQWAALSAMSYIESNLSLAHVLIEDADKLDILQARTGLDPESIMEIDEYRQTMESDMYDNDLREALSGPKR